MGELFLVMLCNQKEACLRCLLRHKNGVKNARIFVEKVPHFKVEQIDNG